MSDTNWVVFVYISIEIPCIACKDRYIERQTNADGNYSNEIHFGGFQNKSKVFVFNYNISGRRISNLFDSRF